MDTEQPLQRHASTATGRLRIMRRDRCQQALSGNDRVHLVEERFFARLLATLYQARIGQAQLFHRFSLRLGWMSDQIFA